MFCCFVSKIKSLFAENRGNLLTEFCCSNSSNLIGSRWFLLFFFSQSETICNLHSCYRNYTLPEHLASGLNETSPLPLSSSFRPAKEATKHWLNSTAGVFSAINLPILPLRSLVSAPFTWYSQMHISLTSRGSMYTALQFRVITDWILEWQDSLVMIKLSA